MKTIFVFAYYSYNDPVFQSAVLPYIKLVKDNNLRFVLLTWEQEHFKIEREQRKLIKKQLLNNQIIWYNTTWHSGRLKLLKKFYDFSKGLLMSLYLIYKYKASKIFSEGFPGAIFGHFLSIVTFKNHLIHTFEPHANYMADARVWTLNSWEYRLLKKLEIPIARHAEKIITATPEYAEIIKAMSNKNNVISIPSCIDISQLQFVESQRTMIRKKLNISENQIVIVYLGKLGGMYMEDELFSFFKTCLEKDSKRFYFFLFTNVEENFLISKLREFEIPIENIFFKYLNKEEVPKYLSAADIGFCGVRAIPSQKYSSPIKTGEYWANGLYTLLPKYVSNDWKLLNDKFGLVFEQIDSKLIERIVEQNFRSPFIKRRNIIKTHMAKYRDINNYKKILKAYFS